MQAHLRQASKSSGENVNYGCQREDILAHPLGYIFEVYEELRLGTSGRISFTELESWQRLTGKRLNVNEIQTVQLLEVKNEYARSRESSNTNRQRSNTSGQPGVGSVGTKRPRG